MDFFFWFFFFAFCMCACTQFYLINKPTNQWTEYQINSNTHWYAWNGIHCSPVRHFRASAAYRGCATSRYHGVVVYVDEKWLRVFVYHKIPPIHCSMYQSWRPFKGGTAMLNWAQANNYRQVTVAWHRHAAPNFVDILTFHQHQLEN